MTRLLGYCLTCTAIAEAIHLLTGTTITWGVVGVTATIGIAMVIGGSQ